MNAGNILKEKSALQPDHVLLTDNGRDFTYREINALANQFANFFNSKNIKKGDRIALQIFNSVDFVIIYSAVIRIGAIVVPIGISLTAREVNEILSDCDPVLFVRHSSINGPEMLLFGNEILVLNDDEISTTGTARHIINYSNEFRIAEVEWNDPLGILYTSGTTGAAKGILLSHGNIISNMKAAQTCYQTTANDSTILFLPLSHCFGLNAILNCIIYSGASMHILRKFTLDALYKILRDENITVFFAVPFIYHLLLKKLADDSIFNNTSYFFSAASKLALETERTWFQRFGKPIYQGYGLTETSPFSTYAERGDYSEGSVGIPVEGVEIKIVDENREALPINHTGEIAIKGPNVMLGYYNKPEITKSVVEDGWFYSGDIGYLNETNSLFIVDRIKDMIIVRGENVYPSEVENVIMELPFVEEVAVYGVVTEMHEEMVKARIVLKTPMPGYLETIIEYCKKNLANYKLPQQIDIVDTIPKSAAGKHLKRIMREEDRLEAADKKQLKAS
ncbi:MAG: class I adenylate-forming enzyme family protein [Chitinophagales bacterium]